MYFRPIISADPCRPETALPLAGGALWFDRAQPLERGGKAHAPIPLRELPAEIVQRLSAPRPLSLQAGQSGMPDAIFERPLLMGILNVTPDSFSDGGRFEAHDAAVAHGQKLCADGADILDIGGESTRPGAEFVPEDAEMARIVPVIEALRQKGAPACLSVDTRKAQVARAALDAGADVINDVSALAFDPSMASVVAQSGAPICLMHAQGAPENMQDDPRYGNVLLDVYDALSSRIESACAAGIARHNIWIDPGIGFGKTLAHNLALLRGIGLFHALGCPILLGVSRKRFIGTISGEERADARMPGSLSVGLEALRQGVQILRVHDIAEHRQAIALWQALTMGHGGAVQGAVR